VGRVTGSIAGRVLSGDVHDVREAMGGGCVSE
jgi:hypothetical protein